MTSSSRERKKKLVDVDLVREDGGYIRVPNVAQSDLNRLLRRVPKKHIRLKNQIGSSVKMPTELVFAIVVNGEERWRNPKASPA